MFSTDRIMRRGAIALVCIAGLGGTALAETMVVRAGGPSARNYPAGKKLAPNSKITLAAGDIVTVLDSKGTRTLRGPGTFPAEASAGAAQTNASFTRLITTQNKRRSRTGAVRADGKPARPDNLWNLDTGRSTTMCVADTSALQLWRPDLQDAATFTLKNEASGKSRTVAFSKGFQVAAWPVADMPVTDGARYTLSRAGQAPVRIAFAQFGDAAQDPVTTASALLAKGCTAQYDVLIAALEATSSSGGTSL